LQIEVDFSFRIGKDAQFLYLLPKLGTILLIIFMPNAEQD